MKVAIITPEELAKTHGVGAQLLRIYDDNEMFWHFYWHSFHGTESESMRSSKLAMWPVKTRRLGRMGKTLMQAVGLAWWYGAEINRFRFRRLLQNLGGFDVAHVIVASEPQARHAVSMLQSGGLPYVLTIYDLMHEDGLTREAAPYFTCLLENAFVTFALTPAIALEASRFAHDVRQIGVGLCRAQDSGVHGFAKDPIKIVITGRPYRRGSQILDEAWVQVQTAFPSVEVHYIGAHFNSLPDHLKAVSHNHGFCESDAEYAKLISSMTIGFLTGPDEDDCFGRFSFPSRAADFCMAGLPLIACVPPESATAMVFSRLKCFSFYRVDQASEVGSAIAASLCNYASKRAQAKSFAGTYFDIRSVRASLFPALLDAAKSRTMHLASDSVSG